jgi:cell division septation protein DedD
MKLRIAAILAALLAVCLASYGWQRQRPDEPSDRPDVRLPNGKHQNDEILRAEHQKNLEDAAELIKLSEDLKAELEKNEAFVLSLGAIKKTEEIEKLAKRVRSRLKRY